MGIIQFLADLVYHVNSNTIGDERLGRISVVHSHVSRNFSNRFEAAHAAAGMKGITHA